MIREMDRELKVSGITVPVNHYQNQELSGDDRLTKELIGVSFVISKPYLGKREMLDFMFKDEAELIEKYCRAELSDRLDRSGVNPGKSWEIRRDLWQKLVSKTRQEGRFDYTYSERLHIFHKGPEIHQLDNVIMTLRDDPHSRRAMVMIFEPEDTRATAGALTRVPCSVSYQFLIRNNRLHVIYYIRSNDFFKHFAIDIWLTGYDGLRVQHPSSHLPLSQEGLSALLRRVPSCIQRRPLQVGNILSYDYRRSKS